MKLLFLAYYFPPVHTPGNVRRYHFYREARKYFEAIHVVTTRNRRLMAQDDSLRLDVPHLTEVPAWDLRRLTLSKNKKSPTISSRRKNNPFFRFLRRLTDSFPFNLLLDDGGPVYIWRAYRAGCRLVEAEGITHVFSSFRPYADHVVAWLLKGRYPELYWMADFRDLHVDPIRRNVLWPAWQRSWNRRILRRADLVTTVSEGLQRQLQPLAKAVYVLRNGIGEEDLQRAPLPLFEKFTIAYTGSLYPGLQTGGVLWTIVSGLIEDSILTAEKFQLIYAGKDTGIWEEWMKENSLLDFSYTLGFLPRRKALEIQRKADVNLLLSWSGDGIGGILCSKLYEYFSAGKPILAIINGPLDNEFEDLFSNLTDGMILYANDDRENTRNWLIAKFSSKEKGSPSSKEASLISLQKRKWDQLMGQFMKKIASPRSSSPPSF